MSTVFSVSPARSTAPVSAVEGLRIAQTVLLISLIAFVPSFTSYLFETSSHAAGTAVVTVLVLLLLLRQLKISRLVPLCVGLGVVIVAHLLAASLFGPVQFGRALLSLLLLGLVFAAASCVGPQIFRLPNRVIEPAIMIMRALMLLIGVAGALRVQPPVVAVQILGFQIGGIHWEKSVFPFTEPSHFALAFVPLLIDACVRSAGIKRYLWLVIGLALGYFLQNLTLIVGVVLAAGLSLPIAGLAAGAVAFAAAVASVDVAYFSDRLDFSLETSNLSSLIYIQGWQLMVDAFHRTSGWGLGFQQLGLGAVNSAAADTIFRLYRFELNLQDGGFTFAKVVGEFGVLGAILVLVYIGLAIKLALRLRRISKYPAAYPSGATYAYAVVLSFSIDLFVRGVGYFNGSALLLFSALYYYWTTMAPSRKGAGQ